VDRSHVTEGTHGLYRAVYSHSVCCLICFMTCYFLNNVCHNHHHQNVWTMEAPSADLVWLECPCLTARSRSQRMEPSVAAKSALDVQLAFSSPPDTSLMGTLVSNWATYPKRPRQRQEMMCPMEDNPVQLVTFWLEIWSYHFIWTIHLLT